jgi:HlyD family secretion protein
MKKRSLILVVFFILYFSSCTTDNNKADGYGNFEAKEVIISAEVNGKIMELSFNEGDKVQAKQVIGNIDTSQLFLKKKQLIASINAIRSRIQDIQIQLDVLLQKKENIAREKERLEKLLKDNAATQKQYDDISGELLVIEKQIIATRKTLETTNRRILSEINPIEVQIEQLNDQIEKSKIISPIEGVILNKFVEVGELAVFGKPLFKIADIENMILKVYISGSQLASIKIGDKVKVLIDSEKRSIKQFEGVVEWISDKAEFTPKIIQTKEERVNLVYAVKIAVKNDGTIKMGMPGEMYMISNTK